MNKFANPPYGPFDSGRVHPAWLDGSKGSVPPSQRTPPSARTQAPAPTPAQAPSQNTFDSFSPYQGVFSNFDARTPQGFAAMAGLFKPLTQNVLGLGGMPALMSIYGNLSGSKDWASATGSDTQADTQPQSSLLDIPGTKQSSFRLPLPISSIDGLRMPDLIKQAGPWGHGSASYHSSPWGLGSISAKPIVEESLPVPPLPTEVQTEVPPAVVDKPEFKEPVSNTSKQISDFGTYTAAQSALQHAGAKYLPKLGLKAVGEMGPVGIRLAPSLAANPMAIPGRAIKGMGLWHAPTQGALSLLDAAGIYKQPGEFSIWQKPKLDNGKPILDEYGNQSWDLGFNPDALGWNMENYNKATDPSEHGYPSAALSAFNQWPKGVLEAGKFIGSEMNPLARDSLSDWEKIHNRVGNRDVGGKSVPLTFMNEAIVKPWRSSLNKENMRIESERWKKRMGDAYHPDYNPTGERDSDQLPHIKRIFSSPIRTMGNLGQSFRDKGVGATLRDAIFRNW